MKYCILALLIALQFSMAAQKVNKEDLYPVPRAIKAKWPRKDWEMPKLEFDECLDGNCSEGEGTRLRLDKMEKGEYGYFFYFTMRRGEFSNQGKDFRGKVYKPKLRFTVDSKKHFITTDTVDFSSNDFLNRHFVGEGGYNDRGWNGETKTVAFAKKFPGATAHRTIFTDNVLTWMDVTLPPGHRFIHYTGRVFPSGDFLSGKAILANGDIYEGFFFKNNFFGPGRLTKKNAKAREGIWQCDSLVVETAVELAPVLTETLPGKQSTNYTFTTEVMGNKQSNPAFYGGTVANNEANGWAVSEFSWRTSPVSWVSGMVYGLWKQNKLQGPGIVLVTPVEYNLRFHPSNSNSLFNNIWYATGIFKDGQLTKGTRFYTNYSTYPNQYLDANDIPKLSPADGFTVETGDFLNSVSLEGCGVRIKGYGLTDDVFKPVTITEGKFKGGNITGFYFEMGADRARNLESLRYPAPYKLTDSIIREAEQNNEFCGEAIRTLKPQYIAGMKKKLAADIAAAEEAKKPPPPFNAYAHIPAETKIRVTSADYAKVDWDALGYKAEADETTREYIRFLEEVSSDVRKYLNETYQRNGSTYKRYTRSRALSTSSASFHSGQEVHITGKTTPIIILHYCQNAGSNGTAKVTVNYEGKKLENNQVLTGGSCEMVTQCSNRICKTTCTGSFEFDQFTNRFYSLWLERNGSWSGSRVFWIVLKDEANTK